MCGSEPSQLKEMELFSLLEAQFGNISKAIVPLNGIEWGKFLPQGNLEKGRIEPALSCQALQDC